MKGGITGQERYGTNRFNDTGVPMQGFKGVPKDRGLGEHPTGVRIPGQGNVNPKPKPAPKCAATTKKGEPCKARPTDEGLCVGHIRQRDAN